MQIPALKRFTTHRIKKHDLRGRVLWNIIDEIRAVDFLVGNADALDSKLADYQVIFSRVICKRMPRETQIEFAYST